MDINNYISSGILEQYVLGTLTQEERLEVERMSEKYPLIQQEIFEISKSLEKYAKLQSIDVDPKVEQSLFSDLPKKNIINETLQTDIKGLVPKAWKFAAVFFLLSGIIGAYLCLENNNKIQSQISLLEKNSLSCDSLVQVERDRNKVYANLLSPETNIYSLSPLENYSASGLKLYYNRNEKINTLQWINAPSLEPGMVYQLWYFGDDGIPNPLETFDTKEGLVEISYVEDAKMYAFTIEPEGGSKVPTMDKLIGTVSLQ